MEALEWDICKDHRHVASISKFLNKSPHYPVERAVVSLYHNIYASACMSSANLFIYLCFCLIHSTNNSLREREREFSRRYANIQGDLNDLELNLIKYYTYALVSMVRIDFKIEKSL